MTKRDPFHEGELRVQERAGEAAMGRRRERLIADHIVPRAWPFLERQSMVVLGSLDPEGNVWASLLFGRPGFVRVPEPRRVAFDLSAALMRPGDPLWANVAWDGRLGMLFIDLATRQRLRVNGHAVRRGDLLRVDVRESYPNCPKYIRQRHFSPRPEAFAPLLHWETGEILKAEHRALIEAADTFFVASAHPERGVDASHRGGPPGFVRFVDAHTIRIPDYRGNSMFNTLGNFAVYPHGGLVFMDFDAPRALQLIGRVRLLWDVENEGGDAEDTGRYWEFTVERWVEGALPEGWTWEFPEASSYDPRATS